MRQMLLLAYIFCCRVGFKKNDLEKIIQTEADLLVDALKTDSGSPISMRVSYWIAHRLRYFVFSDLTNAICPSLADETQIVALIILHVWICLFIGF